MSATTAACGLDTQQLGHLRHFANLARQPPNQWELMEVAGLPPERILAGYRFQLAYMAYALCS